MPYIIFRRERSLQMWQELMEKGNYKQDRNVEIRLLKGRKGTFPGKSFRGKKKAGKEYMETRREDGMC